MAGLPTPLAITHVTLIDGTGAPPVQDATVIFEDERVLRVASSGQAGVPDG